MNKEPKEVDWSKQKPGTIGVTKGGVKVEYICTRNGAQLWHGDGCGWVTELENNDVLLPWESQIAEGHNPDGLTNAQVGEGWRLVSLGENPIKTAEIWGIHDEYKGTVPFARWGSRCVEIGSYRGDQTYRVPITKPKRKVPCGPEHFPPGTVVHAGNPLYHSPVGVYSGGIRCPDTGNSYDWSTFLTHTYADWRRSIDGGKMWLPCYVEVEA